MIFSITSNYIREKWFIIFYECSKQLPVEELIDDGLWMLIKSTENDTIGDSLHFLKTPGVKFYHVNA